MTSRTIVLAIDPNMDNFSVLGLRHRTAKGHQVVIHNTPAINVQGTETVFNFDILITGQANGDGVNEHVPEHRICRIPRHKKFTQAVKLQQAVAAYGQQEPTCFLNIPTWFNGWGGRNYPCAIEWMVVKPNDGARGIGHFTVATAYVNMDYFLKAMNKLLEGEHTQENFDAFIESFAGKVEYHTGGENYPFEGLESLKTDGVVVQSVIQNIGKEYRVITDKDCEPSYFQERRSRDPESKYPQATGGGAVIDIGMIKTHDDLPSCINMDLLRHLCKKVIGPMSSIDIFVTNDGYWGIFEYCNQFGISGVPQDYIFNLHATFVESLVANYIDYETSVVQHAADGLAEAWKEPDHA